MSDAGIFTHAVAIRDNLTAKTRKEITQMYEDLAKDIEERAKQIKRRNPTAEFEQQYLNQLKRQIENQSKQIANKEYDMLRSAMHVVSEAVIEDQANWLKSLGLGGDKMSAAFSYVDNSVVNAIMSGSIYGSPGSWSLSSSIWGDNQDTLKSIYKIVAQGKAANMGSAEIAEKLSDFVNPSKRFKWKGPKGYPPIYAKAVDYNAHRLAVTLSQHAYQESLVACGKKNPFIHEFVWHANGSRVCPICSARDGEHYNIDNLPLDHPNGMCVIEPATDQDISTKLAKWAKGELNDPAIDEFAKSIGVSGGQISSLAGPSASKGTAKVVKNVTRKVVSDSRDKEKIRDFMIASKEEDEDVIEKAIRKEKRLFKGWSEQEKRGISLYSSNAYFDINRWLRDSAMDSKGKLSLNFKEAYDHGVQEENAKVIKALIDKISNTKTSKDIILRRGTDFKEIRSQFDIQSSEKKLNKSLYDMTSDELNQILKGQMTSYKSFISTSLVNSRGFDGVTEIIIEAPKGTRGTSVLTLSKHKDGEGEFLLAPGTRFICTGAEKSDYHMGSLVRVFLKVVV